MSDEPRIYYGGGLRPQSYLPAHNHIIHTPGFHHGNNGFRRFWIPPEIAAQGWSKCPCGWRGNDPKWKTHYALTEHAKWWKDQIKKRGSLDAVYRYIEQRLGRSGDWPK